MHCAVALANWLLAASSPRTLMHLQLQRLVFYAYGAAAAMGLEGEIGCVRFVVTKHGPVNRTLYELHSGSGRTALVAPAATEVPTYSDVVASALSDALAVYGRLTPWALREESLLECKCVELVGSKELSDDALKAHFRRKLAHGAVALPRNLLGAWSFDADRIPTQRWGSLHELAVALSE